MKDDDDKEKGEKSTRENVLSVSWKWFLWKDELMKMVNGLDNESVRSKTR